MKFLACPECDTPLQIPDDTVENELITCRSCGVELEYKNNVLIVAMFEGEDWGE